jgi:hypothetical protein
MVGPGQARRHGFDGAEQAREAADLAGLVLLAALDDQVVGVAAGDDVLGLVARGPEHAHRVVVAHHHVLDRLVRHFADAAHHVLRHHRRGLGVDHHHRVVADDHAGVGVALRGVRIGVRGQLDEADLLLFEVGVGGKGFGAHVRSAVLICGLQMRLLDYAAPVMVVKRVCNEQNRDMPLPARNQPANEEVEDSRRAVQSIEVGGRLLLALAESPGPLPLKELAARAGLVASRAHPYLVSFQRLGLVEQEPGSGYYALGASALQIGLACLHQLDPLKAAEPGGAGARPQHRPCGGDRGVGELRADHRPPASRPSSRCTSSCDSAA